MEMPEGRGAWTATVGAKGQIVIPKEARDMFGIKPGDTLYFNATRVMHNDVLDDAMPGHPHSHFLFGIFTLVSHTTVKTCDRAAEVRISE